MNDFEHPDGIGNDPLHYWRKYDLADYIYHRYKSPK